MNRDDLKRRSDDWIAGAQALMAPGVGQWTLAYYLAGYAVEFALKACLLKRMVESGYVFEEQIWVAGKQRNYRDVSFRTHDLDALIDLAYLRTQHDERLQDGSPFRVNWGAVSGWHSESRYEQVSQAKAEELLQAITDSQNGVLTWLRNYW